MRGRFSRVLAAVAFVAVSSVPALAQAPVMDPIVFPIDTGSIVTVLSGAGAAVMLLWIGPRTAFGLIKGLVGKLKRLGS